MSNFSLKVAKILGNSDDTGWAQSYFFTPENKDLLEKRGSLLACFSLSDQEGANSEFGQELIDRLQKEYYDQASGLPMQRLVNSLEAIAQEVASSQIDFSVEIVAGVFWRGVWYFAVLGEGKVLVKRGPTISAVLVGEADGQVVSSSGKAERGDLVVLGTTGFYILRDDLIQQALSQEDLKKTAEKLSGGLLSVSDNNNAAGLVIELAAQGEPVNTRSTSSSGDQQRKLSFSLPNSFSSLLSSGRWPVLVVSLALVLALSLGGYFFFRQRNLNRRQQAQEVISQVREKYQEAQSLSSLDKDQAIKITNEAQGLLGSVSFDSSNKQEADHLKQDLDQLLTSLTQTPPPPTDSLTEFFSLSEISSDLKIAHLAGSGKTIFILDNDSGKVYSLGWEDKKSAVLLGDEKIKKATKLFSQAGKIILLADDGFYEITNNKLTKIIEIDDSWGKIVDFYGWLGNLYLLDSQNNIVWQYPATQSGFGAVRKWNKEELPQVVDGSTITIDSAIWLVSGKLYRLYQGYLDDTYHIADLGDQVLIYTGADFDNIYLVDKENHRFLTVNKETGQVDIEVRALDLDQAQGLIVSPDETVAVIATSDQLLKIVLN
ncbi:MAG: hypothetical protein PHX72_00010 [Candidatus Shapirobacteria bacterium]|nr:hypothetical protein [Candidatus Shapirobacteria bacterium]